MLIPNPSHSRMAQVLGLGFSLGLINLKPRLCGVVVVGLGDGGHKCQL